MDTQVKAMLRLKRWAVLGASANPNKFGFRILKLLKRYGYTTYPINPRETMIEGERCFSSLKELPIVPDVVDFVVSPPVALEALNECAALGIKNVWLQPGANAPEVVAKAQALGLSVIFDTCVMVESSKPVMLNKKTWAVVNCPDDRAAFAAKPDEFLARQGYTVYLVCSGSEHCEPASKYLSLAALPQKPDVVLIAASPALAAEVLRECKQLGIDSVWLQPGSESEEIIALGNSLNLIMVHHASVIEEWETGAS